MICGLGMHGSGCLANVCCFRRLSETMSVRIVAIVGSYRKGGSIDRAVEEILTAARERGAITETIQLLDRHLEFCTNCRACTQAPGTERGCCTHKDDLEQILASVDAADALVLAAPVNFYNVTALFRRFMERLVGYAYWPWGQGAPKMRGSTLRRKAVLVTAAGMPGFLIPFFTGAVSALQRTAKVLGAHTVGKLLIGLAAIEPNKPLSKGVLRQARALGAELAG